MFIGTPASGLSCLVEPTSFGLSAHTIVFITKKIDARRKQTN